MAKPTYDLTGLDYSDLILLKAILETDATKTHASKDSAYKHGRLGTYRTKSERFERLRAALAQIEAHLAAHHALISAQLNEYERAQGVTAQCKACRTVQNTADLKQTANGAYLCVNADECDERYARLQSLVRETT